MGTVPASEAPSLFAPVAWGVLSLALIGVLLATQLRRRSAPAGGLGSQSAGWLPALRRGERRRACRRAGERTSVLLVGIDGERRIECVVLDRSSAGLRLESPVPAPAGAVLIARPALAPAKALWVPVHVRWCRPGPDGCELGCQFVDELPLAALGHFG